MIRLSFQVRGKPVPQGSVRAAVAGGRAIVISKARGGSLEAWRADVKAAAVDAYAGPPLAVVSLGLEFTFARPKAHFNSRGELRDDAPFRHTTRPDADKLARAVLDALTGTVLADDKVVAELYVSKRYVESAAEWPGVRVSVEELAP